MNSKSLAQASPFVIVRELITLPGSGVLAWTCLFETQQFNDDHYGYILKNSSLSPRAVIKRKAEHVAGRLCIHWCYRMLSKQTLPVIHSDKRGCPIWPSTFKGSISHCRGMAVGSMIKDPHILSLGVDVETMLNDETTQEIARMVLSCAELNVLRGLNNEKMPLNCLISLVFSAKEAIYKALYPIVQHFFDFSAASVVSVSDKKLQFILHSQALPELIDLAPIEVSYYIENDRIVSACIVEDTFADYLR